MGQVDDEPFNLQHRERSQDGQCLLVNRELSRSQKLEFFIQIYSTQAQKSGTLSRDLTLLFNSTIFFEMYLNK